MIPGDIDLTENLDFRKRVKKELPQLPEVWNKKETKLNTSFDFDVTYTTTTNLTVTSSFTNNNFRTYTFNTNYIDDLNTWYEYDSINTYSTISIYNNDNISTYITYADNDIESTSSYTSGKWLLTGKEKTKKDIFGNIIEDPKPIPKIPWGKSYRNYEIKPIAWMNRYGGLFTSYYSDADDYPSIPWKTKCIDNIAYADYFVKEDDIVDRAKKAISWLNDKTRSFIERYLDQGDTDLSYLTNMSWIRVKDAIID